MRYNVEDLVTSVRITLDENRIEQEYIVSEDNNMELNEIIREKLLDAVRSVERIAPVQMLDSVPLVIRKRLSKYIFYSSFSLLTFATKK